MTSEMQDFRISQLAVPGVSLLIAFLSYSSQVLFHYIEPAPLTRQDSLYFNGLVICVWICYARTCWTDPGRIPKDWKYEPASGKTESVPARQRWCRKCEALKSPRAHHCKSCQRCIPKMDHHCPWTNNCVSHFTLPHFIRFIAYAVAAMAYLEYFLGIRAVVLWHNRNLPSYMGPSTTQLSHLFVLMVTNTMTCMILAILFVRTIWCIGANTTTIETWEIDRHHRLLRRARALGGYLDGPDGLKVRIKKQEFPYDIGIYQNIRQNLGGGNNVLGWLSPFAPSSPAGSGLVFETNGFEDPGTSWPPPDPDRIPRQPRRLDTNDPFTYGQDRMSNQNEIDAFKERQRQDLQRWDQTVQRRRPFHERYSDRAEAAEIEDVEDDESEPEGFESDGGSNSGEEGWRSPGGDRLRDYGVDEDAEFYDEDDLPLAELIRRRKEQAVL